MSPRDLAKRRALRRRHEAGAAMFVVSMMISVLAAVGAFALAAAATEVKTSGNERQNTQTHYLSQYGIVAFARESEQGKVQAHISLMKAKPDTCLSLPIPQASYLLNMSGRESDLAKACHRFSGAELQSVGGWASPTPTVPYAGGTPYATGIAPGSLGPIPSNPAFFVEVTDVSQRSAPGYSSGTCGFAVLTGTSYGVTQPLVAGNVAYGSEGVEMQRARFVAGPICPPPQ